MIKVYLINAACIISVEDSNRAWYAGVQSKALFQEAMESGYVLLNTIVLLLIGIAGAGKTSFCHMLFGEDPPTVRRSTPLAQSSIRAISFLRAAASQRKKQHIMLGACVSRHVKWFHC